MDINIETLIEQVRKYNENESDLKVIQKAFEIANDLHKNQCRQSGDPYIIHPLTVASILTEMKADTDTVCAALLHDTIEDTTIPKEDIAEKFNRMLLI